MGTLSSAALQRLTSKAVVVSHNNLGTTKDGSVRYGQLSGFIWLWRYLPMHVFCTNNMQSVP